MYGFIKDYISKKQDEFLNPIKKDLFITLCLTIKDIVDGNVDGDGGVDYRGIIDDTYNTIYSSIFKPLAENNDNLLKELEKQIKYGTRITLENEVFKTFFKYYDTERSNYSKS